MYAYRVEEDGYVIMLEGKDYIIQDSYIPYKADTLEESAELHIKELLKCRETPQGVSKIEELEQQLLEVQQYIIDKEEKELLEKGEM